MVQRAAMLLALAASATGCSLIVGNKLDEPGATQDARGLEGGRSDARLDAVRDYLIKPELPGPGIKGEVSGEGPFLIGEQLTIPLDAWKNTTMITIGGIPCVGASAASRFVCTVSPLTPDGTTVLYARDASYTPVNGIGGTQVRIRRLLVGYTIGKNALQLLAQDTLQPAGEIPLPAGILEPPKISPSGRYVLALIGNPASPAIALADLVNRAFVKLPPACSNLRGSSFEPAHEMLKTTKSDADAVPFFKPERGLWCVSSPDGNAVRFELPSPPTKIGVFPSPSPIPYLAQVHESTSAVDRGGHTWVAGIGKPDNAAPSVAPFAVEVKPGAVAAFGDWEPGWKATRVVLTPAESKGTFGLPSLANDAYVVVLAENAARPPSDRRKLILYHPEGPQLVRLNSLMVGAQDVVDIAWVANTNLVVFDRGGANTVPELAYARVVLDKSSGSTKLELAIAPGVMLEPGDSRAVPVSPFTVTLQPYAKRVIAFREGRVLGYQEYPAAGAFLDDKLSGVKALLSHPRSERLLAVHGGQVSAYAISDKKKLTLDRSISESHSGALLQP